MGDFTGFSFGSWHSADPTTGAVTVYRVSGGDRYDEALHPEIKDRTAEVPGLNGEYYFGSDFGPRTFDIDIAFDSLTEEQFRNLRRAFGTKEIKKLIFDERPYKYYMAKLESPIELSYICFDEPKKQIVGTAVGDERYGVRWIDKTVSETVVDETTQEETVVDVVARERERIYPYKILSETQRIYKGEGKISFTCYFPFAKSVYKILPETDKNNSWAISSGILDSTHYVGIIDSYKLLQEERIVNEETIPAIYGFQVYNPGDVATGIRMYLPVTVLNTETKLTYVDETNNKLASLLLKPIRLNTGDVGVLIDATNGLVVGVSVAPTMDPLTGEWSYTTSGNLYNQYIQAGYFFQIEPTIGNSYIYVEGGSNTIKLFYDYLYF
jgi:predicted phage tail component-like protein